jgi:hypothetical protein
MNPPYIKTEIVGKGENTFYFKDEEMTIRHREDGPASEYYDGEKFYYINGGGNCQSKILFGAIIL